MAKINGKVAAGGVSAAAIAAMVAIAFPQARIWEGMELVPYLDSVGVKTVCMGETRVKMRRYTEAECVEMGKKALAEFGLKVQHLSPGIEKYKFQWAAHTLIAYNVGIGTYGSSSMRRHFNAGEYRLACRAMTKYKYAGGKVLLGLVLRREGDEQRIGEYELCLGDAIDAEFAR